MNLVTFEPKEQQVVWTSGDVNVSAVRSTHSPDHASYRVDTPAGSVVIGGDASNDVLAPAARVIDLRSKNWPEVPISLCIARQGQWNAAAGILQTE
jgi:hypothetical protein